MSNLPTPGSTSLWLGVGALIVSAVMMHPSIASLIALGIVAVLMLLMRLVAQQEGRAAALKDLP